MLRTSRGLIALDVDGVLNPCPFDPARASDWKFEAEFRSTKASGRYLLNLSREMAKAITDLNCDITWLTTWGLHAHTNIGLHFDWLGYPVLAEKPDVEWGGLYGWVPSHDFLWKPRAILELLSKPGEKVVWIDDDADGFHEDFRKKNIAIDPYGRLLTICPEPDVGLTRAHIQQIEDFLNDVVHE